MTDTPDTPEIEAARKALRQALVQANAAFAAARAASDAAWAAERAASMEYDAAEARLRDLLAAAKKEPTP